MLLLTSIICQVLFFRLLFQRHAFVKTAGAHPHSPLTCWALRRTWGAISSRALSPQAKAAPAAGTSEFSPTGLAGTRILAFDPAFFCSCLTTGLKACSYW